jgi:hypothetical protein
MTRTHQKHCRVYTDGVDLSGYARQIGALGWMFGAEPDAALTDEVKNMIIGQGEITAAPINAFLDNDAAGLFALAGTGANDHGTRNLMVAIGANAAPVAGNPVFAWKFEQIGFPVEQGSGFVAASLNLGGASYASTLTYKTPWGVLLQPKAVITAVNTATGIDDNGGASALGGIFVYHIFSSNGTVTVTAQDAATNLNASFSAITGATSGSVDATSAPKHGMIALGTTSAVRQFLRPQIAFGTATTCTYVSAFIRNRIA